MEKSENPGTARHEGDVHEGDMREAETLEDLLALYVGQLDDGVRVDPEQVRAAHPALAEEILKGLEVFVDMDPSDEVVVPVRIVGDYTLRRQIGRGGMGVVYEAWENSMDRRVALKVLPAAVAADDRAVSRFIREAQTAGKLNHPNVVSVHGVGVKEHSPYYAMEYVEGETLAQVLGRWEGEAPAEPFLGRSIDPKRGSAGASPSRAGASASRVPADLRGYLDLASAFADVADGLQHAHQSGVVHRDIKPSNLILDSDGRLRILDFGLALLEGEESLTLSGDFVGTPAYMSPEQAARRKIPVDCRTDIYSLGATLYELLTHQKPFRGKDHADTLSQIIERDPPPPRQLNPRMPVDLETIVLKCLRKDPADRYGTAEALGQDLRRFVRGDPIEARPPAPWSRASRWLWRNRWRLTAGAVVTLSVAVALVLWARLAAVRTTALEKAYDQVIADSAVRLLGEELVSAKEWGVLSGLGSFRRTPLRPLVVLQARELLEGVLEDLDGAIVSRPHRSEAYSYRARALWRIGHAEDAFLEVQKALARDPTFAPAQVVAQRLLADPQVAPLKPGDWDAPPPGDTARRWIEARQYLLRVASLERKPEARGKALEAYSVLLERGEEALSSVEKLEIRLERGLARTLVKDWEGAKADFWHVIAHRPSLAEPFLFLGRVHLLEGKPGEAKKVFEKMYAKKSGEAPFWIALAYASASDTEQALAWAERVGDDFARARLKFRLLTRGKQREKAIRAGFEAIRIRPENAAAHVELGWFLWKGLVRRGEWHDPASLQQVEEIAREAVRLDPSSWPADCLLQRIVLARGAEPEARSTSSRTGWPVLTVPSRARDGKVETRRGVFRHARPLGPEVNDGRWATEPNLSCDGRKLFFGRDAGLGGRDLLMATRKSTAERFGEVDCRVENLAPLNTPEFEGQASLSCDRNELVFCSTGHGATSHDLFVVHRPDPEQPWGVPVRLGDDVNTDATEVMPAISYDGLTLYFSRHRLPAESVFGAGLFAATRRSRAERFANARPLREINRLFESAEQPAPSRDELVLFFGATGDTGQSDIWLATRSSGEEPFGNPVKVRGEGPGPWEGRPTLSADWPEDGAPLYFNRCFSTGINIECEIWEAVWVDLDRN